MSKHAYDILGLHVGASFEEVKAAYRRKAQLLHPDKPTGDMAKFNAVQQAYNVLRTKYEAQGPFDDIFSDIAARNKA